MRTRSVTFRSLPRPLDHTTMSLPFRIPAERALSGERDDTARADDAWAARLAEIVRELLPDMRRRAPHLSERALLAAVERIATHRLADEQLAHRSW